MSPFRGLRGALLIRCGGADDSELCVLPLTADADVNPFRCHDTSRGSRLLFHSILALCYQHLHYQSKTCTDEVQQHKNQANNELAVALTKISSPEFDLRLLDSLLVMFTLDVSDPNMKRLPQKLNF